MKSKDRSINAPVQSSRVLFTSPLICCYLSLASLLANLQESYMPLWSGYIAFFTFINEPASKQAHSQTQDRQVNAIEPQNIFFFTSDLCFSENSVREYFSWRSLWTHFCGSDFVLWEQARWGHSPPSASLCEGEAQEECVRVKKVKGCLCFLSYRLCKSWPISIWEGNGQMLLQNQIPGVFSKHNFLALQTENILVLSIIPIPKPF